MVSHRGPFSVRLLFILYINDLLFCLNIILCKTILFADDTTVYVTGTQINEVYKDMNNALEILSDWFRASKQSLNISKTKYMLFFRSRPREKEDLLLSISNNSGWRGCTCM